MAADSDYDLGAWCNYLLLSEVGLEAFAQFGSEKDASTIESDINRTLFHSGIIYAMSQRFAPDLRSTIREMIDAWDLADDLDNLLEAADQQWTDKDPSAVTDALREAGIRAPFSDVGCRRHVGFRALGINWSLDWENTYSINAVGEHFTAVLQVILADVARLDLCLLPTMISVSLRLGSATSTDALVEGERPGEWLVTLPNPKQADQFDLCVFASTTGLLACSSALHMEKMQELLEKRLQNALLGKTFCVQPFAELLEAFVAKDDFLAFERNGELATEQDEQTEDEHAQLRGPSGPGPGYDSAAHEAHIKNRYVNLEKRLGDILPHLVSSGEFCATAVALRKDGWKDWHILLATYNAIINHLAKLRHGTDYTKERAEQIAHMREIASLDVLPHDMPIPDEAVSEANLRLRLRLSMPVTLKIWNLHINTHRFDIAAVEALLSQRYAYWSNDVEHDDLGF